MRIAFISYEFPPETAIGGIGSYTQQIANLLAGENFEVHIFAGSHIQSRKSVENAITIHRIHCKGPHDFKTKVLPYFEKEHLLKPFQLIESPEIHGNAFEIKRRFPSIPLIVRLHASNYLVESLKKKYIPQKTKWRFFLGALRKGRWDLGYWRKYDYKNDPDYLFVQQAEYITAPSVYMKNWATRCWKINPDHISVLQNPFVERDVFNTAITKNEEHTLIFYGRLNVLKGVITITKAMKRILKNNPDWRWIIVGDDGTAADGKSSMREWMKSHLDNVIKQVTFYDSVPNSHIPELLRLSSIVLIPSLFESFSYVTIEAMCAGKAIVGSKETGIEALIENNVSGMLADPYNVNEWKTTIQKLIQSDDKRKSLGKEAKISADKSYSNNAVIINFYKGILPQKLKLT